ARAAYQEIVSSDLVNQPDWQARIHLGHGQTELALGQPEVALGILQQAALVSPKNIEIHKALSLSAHKAGLHTEALESAKQALSLAPSDIDTICWFAEQTSELDEHQAAIEALARAVELAPERADLKVRLGWAQLPSDRQAAWESFSQVIAMNDPPRQEILQAAEGLLQTGDSSSAITGLERALQANPSTSEQLKIYSLLATANKELAQHEKALEALDKALELDAHNVELIHSKADLLLIIERPKAAIAYLEEALNISPDSPNLNSKLIELYRQEGELVLALEHAEGWVNRSPSCLTAITTTADLAVTLLQTDRARQILSAAQEQDKYSQTTHDDLLTFYCLQVELALEEGAEVAAAEALTIAQQIASNHPRVRALQARMAYRRGDSETAAQHMQKALSEHSPDTHDLATTLSLVLSAVELESWEEALRLLKPCVESASFQPRPHFELAHTLVLRAEAQRLCSELDVTTHAPGAETLTESVARTFEAALLQAARLSRAAEHKTRKANTSGNGNPKPQLHPVDRWYARGKAAFRPLPEHAHALHAFRKHPEDLAAYLAALRRCGELPVAHEIARTLCSSNHSTSRLPSVLMAQAALTLANLESEKALLAAKIAAEHQTPPSPIYHALLARIARQNNDMDTARNAMEAALTSWPDEPRWQAFTARLYLDQPQSEADKQKGIEHYEQAITLEPHHAPHYLALGQALTQTSKFEQAISILQKGNEIAPTRADILLALARAHTHKSDFTTAAYYADQALEFTRDKTAALLLRADIALQASDPKTALGFVQKAIQLHPSTGAYLMKIRCLKALKRYKEALDLLDKNFTQQQIPLSLAVERAQMVEQVHGQQAALQVLQGLSQRCPQEIAVLLPYAEKLSQAGEREQALRVAQQALNLPDGVLSSPDKALLHTLIGRIQRQANQLDLALHHLNLALQHDPEQAAIYDELAHTYHARRQHNKALESYQQAIALKPNDDHLYYQAGLLFKDIKDYARAEEMLRWATKLVPDNLDYHRQLGAVAALNLVHSPREVAL
ncbi:MAG: tetratricopeptide repeat protein, partial [Chloroflexota bacterium]